MTTLISDPISRDADAMPCLCGGYADRVACTKEEIEEHQWCGRSYECCVRAFVCRVCKTRLVGNAESPEIE